MMIEERNAAVGETTTDGGQTCCLRSDYDIPGRRRGGGHVKGGREGQAAKEAGYISAC